MKRLYIVLLLSCIFLHVQTSNAQDTKAGKLFLKASNYVMDINLDYDNDMLNSTCRLTVTNPTGKKATIIPLLLYRLMKVKSIKDKNGNSLLFTQQVLAFEDWERFQINFVEVHLDEPILSNESREITIEYDGYLLGYTETGMGYLHDNISPEFTMIRTDCYAYPRLGYPSFSINRSAGYEKFDYTISVTVPDSLTVANGGKLVSKDNKDGLATYTYKNIKPAWRIDIAISKFKILEENNMKIFCMPEDSIGAQHLIQTANTTFKLYTQWWGPLNEYDGFSILEIPDNWGSQADVTCIIQTSAAFKKKELDTELYHEISHIWNVQPLDTHPPRWNEGLAMFAQYLTKDKLNNTNSIEENTNKFIARIKADESYKDVPLIDYGKENLTGRSYKMGMVMFSVLYNLVGEQQFNSIIRTYYQKYNKTGASTEDFVRIANELTVQDLSNFVNDWIYTTNYFDLIQNGYLLDDLVKNYKKS